MSDYVPMLTITTCVICGKNIHRLRPKKRTLVCGPTCRRIRENQKYLEKRQKKDTPVISCGTTGAISELRVSADLLGMGYAVFRALSPSCSCDLAVLYKNNLLRIEVTTGIYSPYTGKINHPTKDSNKFDVLAVVLPDCIQYFPPDFNKLVKELQDRHSTAADGLSTEVQRDA